MKTIVIFDTFQEDSDPEFLTVLRACRNRNLPVERVRSDMLKVGVVRFLFLYPEHRNLNTFFKKHTHIDHFYYRKEQGAFVEAHRDAIEKALPSKKDLQVFRGSYDLLQHLPDYEDFPYETYYKLTIGYDTLEVRVRPGEDTSGLYATEEEAYLSLERKQEHTVNLYADRLTKAKAHLQEIRKKRAQAVARREKSGAAPVSSDGKGE